MRTGQQFFGPRKPTRNCPNSVLVLACSRQQQQQQAAPKPKEYEWWLLLLPLLLHTHTCTRTHAPAHTLHGSSIRQLSARRRADLLLVKNFSGSASIDHSSWYRVPVCAYILHHHAPQHPQHPQPHQAHQEIPKGRRSIFIHLYDKPTCTSIQCRHSMLQRPRGGI